MPQPNAVIALLGNPNAGKTTLFNVLTGLRRHVANYPGVTVEIGKGSAEWADRIHEIVDLPGTYSLAARSPDEMVAVDFLLGRIAGESRPDAVIAIVDACNLERHLYLTTQLADIGLPIVIAVNMMDRAAADGIRIDVAGLSQRLGCPVVPIQANRGVGVDDLKGAVTRAIADRVTPRTVPFPEAFRRIAAEFHGRLGGSWEPFLLDRLILDVGGYTETRFRSVHSTDLGEQISAVRDRLAAEGMPVPAIEAKSRYAWIRETCSPCIHRDQGAASKEPSGYRLDRLLLHRVWGTLFFLLLMFGVFQSIFVGAEPLKDLIVLVQEKTAGWVSDGLDPGPFRSLLVDGIIGGVGGILVFLPQILILFGAIAVLEDCGYMARAAFLMDKLMSRCGLSGKSFIPLLSSAACAVPGIMATRVIENRRDRFATILVAPLMSCSARLPVYSLMTGLFFADPWWLSGVILFAMYMVGFVAAPLAAWVLKRTLLRGETPVFLMEMPPYRRPRIGSVLRRMFDAGWAFVRRAGTFILATMVIIWALLYFPNRDENGRSFDARAVELEEQLKSVPEGDEFDEERRRIQTERNELLGLWKQQSVLGRFGRSIEGLFRPLGWDWKIGTAAMASFPAREAIVGTLRLLYDQGPSEDEGDEEKETSETSLGKAIQREWTHHPGFGGRQRLTALSVMVFFALCCQCASTLAVIRRETRSWAWPTFTFVYMTVSAYVAALLVFQVGKLVTG